MGEDKAQGQSKDRSGAYKDREMGPGPVRCTIPQAAEILGFKEDTIRKRIQRGTLESTKVGGRVHVYIPYDDYLKAQDKSEDKSGDESQDAPKPSQDVRNELVETLREQVAYLQGVIATRDQELALRAEEIRRRDAALEREQELAAMFADRLRELEAPREAVRAEGPSGARTSPETAPGGLGAAWDTWQGEPKEPSDYSEHGERQRERRETPVSSGPIDTPQSPAEEAHGAAERPFTEEEPQPERSWWRRFFGF